MPDKNTILCGECLILEVKFQNYNLMEHIGHGKFFKKSAFSKCAQYLFLLYAPSDLSMDIL